MKRQKSILSFFLKPSQDSTENKLPPSALNSGIRGSDTPEKLSHPIFFDASPASDQKHSDSPYSHILKKFKREEESSITKKRNRDDYSPLSSCPKFDEFDQNQENTEKITSVGDGSKNHISRINSNNLCEDDIPTFELFPDITAPETPVVQQLIPRLKCIQETEHELSTCGFKDRAKSNEHLIKDATACRETSEVSRSKFEWLNPSVIRDANRRRPSDPLYDKRTLFIPPDALKKMSASQKQYWSVKCEYMDIILFFKVGKFYELYELDAEIGQKELGWKMTISGVGKCRQVGISESGIEDAVQKLTARGYKVGRIEQLETSDQAKAKGTGSVIERRLVQVLTPATTTDNNIGPDAVHLLFIKEGLENGSPVYGFAFLDYAALKFSVGSITDDSGAALGTLLMHVSPREIVYENTGLSEAAHKAILKYASSGSTTMQLTPVMPSTDFQDPFKVENIIRSKGYFKGSSSSWNTALDCIVHRDLAICALDGLVAYLRRLKLDDALRNGELLPYHVYKSCLRMDAQTLLNLEIFNNNIDGGLPGTLYQHLDHCMTRSGRRLLRRWICHPLKDISEINDRLNVVDGLMNEPGVLSFIIENLRKLPDLERLLGRVKASVGSSSTVILPFIGKKILKQRIKSFGTLVKGLRTGIDLLKVLLENDTRTMPITKFANLSLTCELNETLKQFEEAVDANFPLYLNHEIEDSDAEKLSVLTGMFIEKSDAWSSIISALDYIDVFQSFASTAISSSGSMSRPTLLPTNYNSTMSDVNVKGPLLKLKGLWHPYAVKSNGNSIVPNDIYLGEDTNGSRPRALLLTGPNMGGKSTLLRATCLAVILAQLGCYVPCDECVMTPADIIFTRLGAMDRIMAGESTFLVECSETSSILQNASQDSIVLLDELGRGTSTFDGYAIAYAVFRHLVETVGCRLLFATHYHPLTKEFASHPRVCLQHMACALNNPNTQNELVFLYKLASGPSPESYGLQVALMAGIPKQVVQAASKASAKMKAMISTNFKSSEERSKFSTLHEEWIKTLIAVMKNGESLDEDAADTLFCLWHEIKSYYGSSKSKN